MKRPDVRDAYLSYSAGTSEKVRQLSFAALGVIWVFRPASDFSLPTRLVMAGVGAVVALTADFLQSLYGTVAWGVFHRQKELAGLDNQEEFKAPRQINWPTNVLFGIKVLALALRYGLLFSYLVKLLQAATQ